MSLIDQYKIVLLRSLRLWKDMVFLNYPVIKGYVNTQYFFGFGLFDDEVIPL